MIIKCLTSKTPRYFQILEYLNKNEGKIYNNQNQTFIYKQNLYGLTNKQISREFMNNEKNRIYKKSNNIKFYQDIIAFSDLDKNKLSIPIIEDLTKEYIRQRSPYLQAYAIAHFNGDSHHVHIISSPIEVGTGLNLRLSKKEFADLKLHMQKYQQERYPELSNSIVRHGLNEGKTNTIEMKNNNHKIETTLEKLKYEVNQCYINGNGQQHFLELLKQKGLKTYQRDGFIVGIVHNFKKYRFTKLLPGCHVKIDTREELVEKNRYEELQELRYLENERMEREIDEMDRLGLFDREM